MSFSYVQKGIEIIEADMYNEHVRVLWGMLPKMGVMGYVEGNPSAGAAIDFETTEKLNF